MTSLLNNIATIIPHPQYCERLSDPVGYEPINLITNLTFVFAAFLLFKQIKKKSLTVKLLLTLLFLAGVGSGLWHMLGTTTTLFLDYFPIYLFAAIATYSILYHLTSSGIKSTLLLIAYTFIIITVTILTPAEFINGSIRHVINIILTSMLVWKVYRRFKISVSLLIPPTYLLAITFRTIDMFSCPSFPIGTHFLWHIFAAIVLYLMAMTIHKLESNKTK